MLAVFCSHLVSIMQFRQSLLFFSSFIGPFDFVLRCLNLFMSKPYFHCVLTTNHWHEELYSAQVSLASFFWFFLPLHMDPIQFMAQKKSEAHNKHLRITFPSSTLTCCNALASEQHDGGEADAEDGTLTKVEHGERGRGF